MKRFVLVTVITLIAATAALADIARPGGNTPKPKPLKTYNGHMSIQTRSNVGIATLSIRKDKLKQLRAAVDEADDRESNTAAVTSFNIGGGQTVMAGLLLSVGLVLGGFVFYRRTARSVRVAASIAILGIVGVGAFTIYANVPPPRSVNLTSAIFDKNTKAYGYAEGQIVIQVIDGKTPGFDSGDDVILQIPATDEDRRGEE